VKKYEEKERENVIEENANILTMKEEKEKL
jgi:hypothetical protein